jgi:hypothetical protein
MLQWMDGCRKPNYEFASKSASLIKHSEEMFCEAKFDFKVTTISVNHHRSHWKIVFWMMYVLTTIWASANITSVFGK